MSGERLCGLTDLEATGAKGITLGEWPKAREFVVVRDGDQISVDLKLLTARRLDIIHDRVRAINRLRATMLEYFPALERAFDYSKSKAALTLLSTYQTPGALRRMGVTRLAA